MTKIKKKKTNKNDQFRDTGGGPRIDSGQNK